MMQRGINKERPDNPGYEPGLSGRSTTTSDGRAAVLTGATRLVSGQPANSVGNYRFLRARLPREKQHWRRLIKDAIQFPLSPQNLPQKTAQQPAPCMPWCMPNWETLFKTI